MMKIKDILRHRHDLALPGAQIAAAVGVSTGTVSHVLARAEAAGLSWPLPDDLDDEALRARLYPAPGPDGDRVQPDWDAVIEALTAPRKRRRARLTRRQLWVEYRDEALAHGGKPYTYSRFCALLGERLGSRPAPAQMRFHYAPGLWGLSEFSGKTLGLRTGRGEKDVEIFVAVLAHSNLVWAEAVPDQSVRHWIMARLRVLRRRPRALDHRQPQGRRRQAGPRGAPAQSELPRVRTALRRRRAAGALRAGDGQGAGRGLRRGGSVAYPAGAAPSDLLLAGRDERRDPARARPAEPGPHGLRRDPARAVRSQRAGAPQAACRGTAGNGASGSSARSGPTATSASPAITTPRPSAISAARSTPGSASAWSNSSSTRAGSGSPSTA